MPSTQTCLNQILEQMGQNTAILQDKLTHDDEQRAETKSQLEQINTDFASLKNEYNELSKELVALKRPRLEENVTATSEKEERKVFETFVRYGTNGKELRALSGTTDPGGGFMVPQTLGAGVLMDAYNLAAMRRHVRISRTATDSFQISSLSKPTVGWGTVGAEDVEEQELITGRESIPINKLTALIKLEGGFLEDAGADVIGEMRDGFAQAVAEAEDDALAVGTGNQQPLGIFSDQPILDNFVATGTATKLTDGTTGLGCMFEAFFKLKPIYHNKAIWIMNSATEAEVRSIKDAEGKYYLWSMPNMAGDQSLILGKPVANPESAPNVAANTYPIMFANLQAGYRLVDRSGLVIRRFDEKYGPNYVGFVLQKRMGGSPVRTECFVPIKVTV